MSKIDNFSKVFSQKVIKIELEHLNYANEIINIDGSRLDKSNDENIHRIFLSLDGLQEINIIAYTLYHLEKKGITTSNYPLKVKQYRNLCSKLFNEFGVVVSHRDEHGIYANDKEQHDFNLVPFSNPAELFEKIDIILTLNKLTVYNKKNFYLEFFNRERIPKQNKIHNEIKKEEIRQKQISWPIVNDAWILEEFVALYINLPKDQRNALMNNNNAYKYDEEYYIILEKYQVDKMPKDIYEYLKSFNVDDYYERHDKYIDADKSFENALHFHNFLNYPACLYTEAEYFNTTLNTDKYKSSKLDDGYDL